MLRPRKSGETVRVENDWFVRQDGSLVAVAYSSAPVPLEDGFGAVVWFRDIAAEKGDHRRDVTRRNRVAHPLGGQRGTVRGCVHHRGQHRVHAHAMPAEFVAGHHASCAARLPSRPCKRPSRHCLTARGGGDVHDRGPFFHASGRVPAPPGCVEVDSLQEAVVSASVAATVPLRKPPTLFTSQRGSSPLLTRRSQSASTASGWVRSTVSTRTESLYICQASAFSDSIGATKALAGRRDACCVSLSL